MNERSPEFKREELLVNIAAAVKGLGYISETDAPVELFSSGPAENVDIGMLIDEDRDRTPIEELAADQFFKRLTTIQNWYGKDEIKKAERFARLQKLLEQNLRGIKVFKVGRVQKTIYVVGLDAGNNLTGIKTHAVET